MERLTIYLRSAAVARHIADLHGLATDLGGDSPVAIVGHSWGAMLALCYAAAHPDKVGPIALVGCGTFDQASRRRMHATIEERMKEDKLDRSQSFRSRGRITRGSIS